MFNTKLKKLLMFIGAIIVFILLYNFVYWPNSLSERRHHSWQLAEDQAKVLREKFKHEARFKYVQFIGTFKREDLSPLIMVSGMVRTKEDFFAVTNDVESLRCPLEIFYNLTTSNQYFERSDQGGKPVMQRETH
ncbi:MAG TPA: hypothetical protein VIK35_09800 [Verrucomicrobiae bacterium]